MIEVSPEFKQAVYEPTRRTTARVTFDFSDTDAAEDATSTVTNEAEISRKDQLTNRKFERPAYATFERDYWRLDGSFVLPPKPNEPDFEVGWYSDTFSGPDGGFDPHLVMNFTFMELHSSIGLTIIFDEHSDEYATDFDIEVYGAGDTLIRTIEVRDHDQARYILDREQLSDYQRITVTLYKWSRSDRRAKVVEVIFGVIRTYDDDNLVKLNLVEEINPTSAQVPANELTFTFDNSNREFNILNPEGSYEYLQERQQTELEIGVEASPNSIEYVSMGRFYLIDWQSDEGSLTATFTARNIIDFIPNDEIENESPGTTNLKALAETILSSAGITRYNLDPALESISTQGLYKKQKYRELLQNIAVAGQCVMFGDRNDTLNMIRITDNGPVDNIDFDNTYSEPKVNLERLVSRVEVNYYNDVETVAGTYAATNNLKGGATLKVENTLINSQSHAQDVANWILAESQKRILYDINWRQNPALECGDVVTIEDVYGANKSSRIISQEYEYAGYLAGKTKSKGSIS